MNTDARKKLMGARTALVLDQPFFGVLALQLALKEDTTQETAWVDGETLGYNPAFVESLSHAELLGIVAHEVMHCAAGHPWRRDAREPKRWNEACDFAINQLLVESGFTLPGDALLDATYAGKSAEWIYDRLPAPPPESQGGDEDGPESGEDESGDGQAQKPSSLGEVRDCPTESEKSEAEWAQSVQQAAAAAKARGALPGGAERFASDAVAPKVDWRSALRRFVQQCSSSDYAWTRPNRRYLAQGLYLPSLHSETLGSIAIAIDTSGSIDQVLLDQFRAEVQTIADEMRPSRVHVLYCDAQVNRQDVFERDDVIEFNPAGGGGTDFCPVFDELEKLEEPPVCLVYLTDLEGSFPEITPDVETLWVTTGTTIAPFGETIEVKS